MRLGGIPLAGLFVCIAVCIGACGGGDIVIQDQPDGGSPDPSAIGTLGAACDKSGALACAGHAQKLQLLCDGAKWVANGVCPDDKICDTRPGPNGGSCQSPDPKCVNKKSGEVFCDGAIRRLCDADLLSSTSTPCGSPELCSAGAADKCAKCLKGQKLCEGVVLKRCADDGQSFVLKETCATAAQCIETADTCSPPTCAVGDYRCDGDKLQTCKDTRNDWNDVKICPSGLCDAAAKDCRECVPDAKDCAADTPRLCDKSGRWTSLTPCSGVTPLCKAGLCSPGTCLASEYRCNLDTLEICNAAKTGFDPVKVCSPGLCDALGKTCDDCKSGDKRCTGSTPGACDSTGHWKDLAPCSGSTPVCKTGVCAAGVCSIGDYRCTGDALETCNASLTGWDTSKSCPAGKCDAALKQCDECASGDTGCSGATPLACDSSFHWKSLTTCSGSTPTCASGTCVAAPPTTTVTFPSSASETFLKSTGSGVLGTGGGGVHYAAGDYVQESFARSTAITQLDLSFKMSDMTSTYCASATLSWDVKVNGTTVGSYSWVSGSSAGDKTIAKTYTFAAIAPVSGKFTLRLEAASTVCAGGGSWNWYAGGTAIMK